MRMQLSFLLSLSLHGVVLALPLFVFGVAEDEQHIPVVLLTPADGEGRAAAEENPGIGTRGARSAGRRGLKAQTDSMKNSKETLRVPEMIQTAGMADEVSRDDFQAIDSGDPVASLEAHPSVPFATGPRNGGEALAAVITGGSSEENPPFFSPVHYAHHPKPDYPERARRKGWEGTVLLRVLVDRRGGAKGVELSQSSGFAVLDRAAIETVKGWRFQPARSGENAVESRVKVPIVFRLAETKD